MPRSLMLVATLSFACIVVAQTDAHEAQQELRSGEKISTALATVTSTAISPLVGVCVMGVWQYYHTPRAQRDQLSLTQKPKFWIPIFVLLLLILFILARKRPFAEHPRVLPSQQPTHTFRCQFTANIQFREIVNVFVRSKDSHSVVIELTPKLHRLPRFADVEALNIG